MRGKVVRVVLLGLVAGVACHRTAGIGDSGQAGQFGQGNVAGQGGTTAGDIAGASGGTFASGSGGDTGGPGGGIVSGAGGGAMAGQGGGALGSGGILGMGGTRGGGGTAGAPPPDGGVACTTATTQNVTVANLPPDVLLLFDRSGSMSEDLMGVMCPSGCGANSKWSIATTTVDEFLPTTEAKVNWGLKMFASNTNNTCSVSSMVEVAPASLNAAAIATRLAATVPGSQTPTTAALLNAARYLTSLDVPNPKFILLVTDGVPGCGLSMCPPGTEGSVTPNTCDEVNAIAMVKSIHDDMGIPVFVLGIGTANSPGDPTLSAMAVNGGFPRNSAPAYYPIDSARTLADTLAMVSTLASTCWFSVTPSPKTAADVGRVTADGNPVLQDSANGWTFAAMPPSTGVVLHGSACDAFKAGAITSVQVTLCSDDTR